MITISGFHYFTIVKKFNKKDHRDILVVGVVVVAQLLEDGRPSDAREVLTFAGLQTRDVVRKGMIRIVFVHNLLEHNL